MQRWVVLYQRRKCNAVGQCTDSFDTCDDGNVCTDDTCDEAQDLCDHQPRTGATCSDGNACTTGTTCQSNGSCGGGTARICDDSNPCTDDSCDIAGGCVYAPRPTGSVCDDGLYCTVGETCAPSGDCVGQPACIDGRECTDDVCDEDLDLCVFTAVPGRSCDDFEDCTENDTCLADASCTGTPLPNGTDCSAAGGCQTGGVCAGGTCQGASPMPDGTSCDDEDACTADGVCSSGVCLNAPDVVCDDQDACTVDGCDSATGCVHQDLQLCTDPGPPPPIVDPEPDPFSGHVGGGGCGCDSKDAPWSPVTTLLFVSAGLILCRRRRRGHLVALVLVGLAAPASAQGIDAENFSPASSSTGFLSQPGARVLPHAEFNIGLVFGFATDLLVVRDEMTNEPLPNGDLLDRRWTGHFVAAVGLLDRLELGLDLPLIIDQGGDTSLLPQMSSLSATMLGDVQIAAKGLIWAGEHFSSALSVTAKLPTGDVDAFAGDDGVSVTSRAIVGLDVGRIRTAMNAGYRVRKRAMVGDLEVGDQFVAGAAASAELWPRRLWAVTEAFLAVGVQDAGVAHRPAEWLGGLRGQIFGPWSLSAAAGLGVTQGHGAPGFRGVFSLAYSPLPAEKPEPFPVVPVELPPPRPPISDPDLDGLADVVDACPSEPEDRDGFEDGDGCPDPDNDLDEVLDVVDKCPDEPETINGVDDQDGCPDKGLFVMVQDRIVLEERVLFESMRARVRRRGRPVLRAIVTLWKQHPEWEKIAVEGHADLRGSSEYNQWISNKRAQRVAETLIRMGLPEDKIEYRGLGDTQPRAEGHSEEDHKKNRRVEFVITRPSERPAGTEP